MIVQDIDRPRCVVSASQLSRHSTAPLRRWKFAVDASNTHRNIYSIEDRQIRVTHLDLVVQRFDVEIMIETSLVRIPAGALSSQLGQLSLPSLRGRYMYICVNRVPTCMAGVRRGAFTCVGWQVTLCDPIWQVTSRSSEMGFPWTARPISAFTFSAFTQTALQMGQPAAVI